MEDGFTEASESIELSGEATKSNEEKFDTIWIASVGDLMCHGSQFLTARTKNGYDFKPVFENVKPALSNADITFGNLETVTAGEDMKYSCFPKFNTPSEYSAALKYAGFDVITTANNHSLDRGFEGLVRTLNVLDKNELKYTGTFRNESEAEKILIVEEKGIKLAILAYTYGTNGLLPPKGKEFSVNLINEKKMESDIKRAKDLNADKVIVFIHWGEEYKRNPGKFQRNLTESLFHKGVDIIFGSHPHVIQPMEVHNILDETGNSRESFVIYSMGNFVSNQRKQFRESGVIVKLQLIKNQSSGETFIGEIDYVPTYVSKARGFKVLDVRESIKANESKSKDSKHYSPGDHYRLLQVWNETTSQLNMPGRNVFATIDESIGF